MVNHGKVKKRTGSNMASNNSSINLKIFTSKKLH